MQTNQYIVSLYDRENKFKKSDIVIASSEEEAIEKVRHVKWWYEEGLGHNHKPLLYPLTFKAVIYNQ